MPFVIKACKHNASTYEAMYKAAFLSVKAETIPLIQKAYNQEKIGKQDTGYCTYTKANMYYYVMTLALIIRKDIDRTRVSSGSVTPADFISKYHLVELRKKMNCCGVKVKAIFEAFEIEYLLETPAASTLDGVNFMSVGGDSSDQPFIVGERN